jgi:hypothetical protein
MTLHATREGQSIKVHGNTGVDVHVSNSQVREVVINENAQHVRWFHTQLGQLLDEADAEREAAARPQAEHLTHDPHERPMDHA